MSDGKTHWTPEDRTFANVPMQNLLGVPVSVNGNLPEGSAVLIVQDHGVVKQMVEAYNGLHGLPTRELILELKKRQRPCSECEKGAMVPYCKCFWLDGQGALDYGDQFVEKK